jgi:hypothetical protein
LEGGGEEFLARGGEEREGRGEEEDKRAHGCRAGGVDYRKRGGGARTNEGVSYEVQRCGGRGFCIFPVS